MGGTRLQRVDTTAMGGFSSIWSKNVSILLGLVLLCSQSQSQTSPETLTPSQQAIDQQRRARERETQQRAVSEAAPTTHLQSPPAKALSTIPENESPCFVVQSVDLAVGSDAQFSWLKNHIVGGWRSDSPLNRCIGAQGVQVIVDRLQNALLQHGYLTTRIVAEGQDLQAGKLVLTVLPGKLATVRWNGQEPDTPRVWSAIPARKGDILTLWDVEQYLENLQRVPTSVADIQIAPSISSEPLPLGAGWSDLIVTHNQQFPLRLGLTLDDSGAPSTGVYQGGATLSIDNPLMLSDLFYVSLNHDVGGGDPGERGTRGHTVHYSLPIGYWSIGFTASNSRYHQTVVGSTQDYLYQGTSENNEVKLSRVLQRNGAGKTTAYVSAFQRKSNNFIDDTEVEVQRRAVGGWVLGVDYRGRFGVSSIGASLSYKQGTGDFDAIPAPEETFGEGTSRMRLLNADLTFNVPFSFADASWYYTANFRTQNNHTPLTPQDRFTIGGRNTVRGFDGLSVLSAERGWLLRNELSTYFGSSRTALYMAFDCGEVGGPGAAQLSGTYLSGAVVGLRGGIGTLQFDIFAGGPIVQPPQFKTAPTTAGFTFSADF